MNRINSGKQLKILAVIIFIVIVVAGCYLSYDLSMERYGYAGRYTALNGGKFFIGISVSVIVGYLASIMLYAFGDLVDNTAKTVQGIKELKEKTLGETNPVVVEEVKKVPLNNTQD